MAPSTASAAFDFLPGAEGFSATAEAEGGTPATQAGSHPAALRIKVGFAKAGQFTDGDLRDLSLELPPGLIENPTAVPRCSQADFHTPRSSPFEASRSGESCPDRTQVGTITVRSSHGGGETRTFGLFNLVPPPGCPRSSAPTPYGAPIVFTPQVRQAEGEYGITLRTHNIPQLLTSAA